MIVRLQSIWLATPPLTESGSWGAAGPAAAPRTGRGTCVADDDLAARLFGQPDLVRRADPLGLALQRDEVA